MKPASSLQIPIRTLNYHCRTWGKPGAPLVFLLHGYQDCADSWQFTVDALQQDWYIIAPDWRGYGQSDWSGQDTYWNHDYLGDLDALAEALSPNAPLRLVALSMGGQVAALYAGIRPDRVSHLANLEGFSSPLSRQDPAPRRLGKWLQQLRERAEQRPYSSFEEFAMRLQAENPRLTTERAMHIAQAWGQLTPEGLIQRRADPAHKQVNPSPMSSADTIACWSQTQAKVLWVDGSESGLMGRFMHQADEFEQRTRAYQSLDMAHIEGAGHNIHHDQPERLAQVLEPFLLSA